MRSHLQDGGGTGTWGVKHKHGPCREGIGVDDGRRVALHALARQERVARETVKEVCEAALAQKLGHL